MRAAATVARPRCMASQRPVMRMSWAAKVAAQGRTPDIGVQVSLGSSSSRSDASEDQLFNRASTVQAGATAAFIATGGDVTVAGSNVSAKDVVLAAKDRVNLLSTSGTDATRSSNRSSSASAGVSWTSGTGFGISASMQNAHGDANSDAAMQNASHVSGANSVTLISGGDTNLIGSQVSGKQVSAEIGGNLNIASVQDTTVSTAHQSSAGGGFSISQAGGGASFSAQNGDANGSYAGVNEQAGIYAGDNGFNINVRGNTDLKGAVIASTADASKNTLTTGTLTFSDIANRSNYDAKSSGFSAGASTGLPGKAAGPASVPNSGGITPSPRQHGSGSDSATTKSGISAGTLTVTDAAHQVQDIASLNRDTSNTNGTVAKLPDVNNLLDRQAGMMGAASAAGQAVSQGIGDYADRQAKETGNAAWDEGGTNRIALHVIGGALTGGLAGGGMGSAAQGAAGAGIAAWAAGDLNRMANGTRDAVGGGDAAQMAGNVLANVVAGAGGFLIGGTTGAFTASNSDLYNRSTGNGDGQGSTKNSLIDSVVDWTKSTYGSPVEDIRRWGNQFAGLVVSNNGQTPPADPNPLVDAHNGGNPPATGGAFITPPAMACAPGGGCAVSPPVVTGTGYVPSNAIFNSGNGDGQSASAQSGSSPVVIDSARAGHMFRDSEGHLADTPANRTLLEQVANDPGAVAGTDKYGTVWSSAIQPDGTQVWVGVRSGKVSYGGVNQIPKEFNSQTGFSSPTRAGGTK
jgi:filamentous hemagglutinin